MACGSCRACRGYGRASEVHVRDSAPTPAWKTLRVFHSRLDAGSFEVQSGGPAPTPPTGPPQSYFLNGATIPPKVTFLDGLTGGLDSGPAGPAPMPFEKPS